VLSELTPSSQQNMASQTLKSDADHDSRVRDAEVEVRIADTQRGDFKAFQSALTSLEEHLQDFWRRLKLDPAIKESFAALIMEKRKQCEAIDLLLDSVVSRYDRFLNLVTYPHPHSNGCLIKNVIAIELHQYTDG
jgi:hypothetical protein